MAEKSKNHNATVPDSWPGAFGLYKYSKATVMVNVWDILGLLVLSFFVSGAASSAGHSSSFFLFRSLADIVSVFFTLALIFVQLAGTKGKVLSIGNALKKAWSLEIFINFLALVIIIGVVLVISFILFIIPFILIMPRLVLAPYYMVDKRLSIGDSLKASWEDSRGYSGRIWGIVGANIAMALLMLTIIGIPFSLYFLFMYYAAFAVTYRFVTANKVKKA